MTMICPKCGGKTKVCKTLFQNDSNTLRRERWCMECGLHFTTLETIIEEERIRMNNKLTLDEITDLYKKFGLM